MESLGVKLQFTAPYSPQGNPTERMSRTVKTLMAQYIEGHLVSFGFGSWDELLPEISLAIDSSVADSTGFTPAFRLPSALYDEVTPAQQRGKSIHQRQREVFEVVRSNLQKASKGQSRRDLAAQHPSRQHQNSVAGGLVFSLGPRHHGERLGGIGGHADDDGGAVQDHVYDSSAPPEPE
ncbi:hypothetical protein AWZ03_014985, partial [Drosophila navojoa]